MISREEMPEETGRGGFTLRASVVSVLLTVLLVVISSYVALRVGALPWPIIFSAVIAGSSLKIISRFTKPATIHEMNVAQAGGTIGGLLASGMVFTIPGILFLNRSGAGITMPGTGQLIVISLAAGVLGIFLSIPVRRIFIDEYNLPYPSGSAGAKVLQAGYNLGKEAAYLTVAVALSGIFVIARDRYLPAGLTAGSIFGIPAILYPMPLAIGVGYILGPRGALYSWGAGSIAGWFLLLPLLTGLGICDQKSSTDVMQNLGMGLVIGAGIGFFISYVLPRAKKIFKPFFVWTDAPWYTRFVPIVSVSALIALVLAGVDFIASAVAVGSAWIMVSVAGMMTGETDVDPLEQFGIIAALFLALVFKVMNVDSDYGTLFLVACFVAVSAAVAGDIGHDYKSARMLGTKAKDIVKIDLLTVVVASILAPFVMKVIADSAGSALFTPAMPAPQAQMVAGSIEGFKYPLFFWGGFIFSFIWVNLEALFKKKMPVIPMVLGIGLFLGPPIGLMIGIGGFISLIVSTKSGGLSKEMWIVLAAGLIGGESIAGFAGKAAVLMNFSPDVSDLVMTAVFLSLLAGGALIRKKRSI